MKDNDHSPFTIDSVAPKQGAAANEIPDRYVLKSVGADKVLTSKETPNLQVIINSGLTFNSSAVRKSSPGTIYLDGVAQSEPFLDHEKQVYNLDHHEGCVRAFTLATCEQALIMCVKGLDLRDREWKIYAGEPDLDVILSVWIILNHQWVNDRDAIRRRSLIALVRLEGIIDSLGLELRELSGLPDDLQTRLMKVIDRLRVEEIELKKNGTWAETDYPEYVMRMLRQLDQYLLKLEALDDFQGIEELSRIELTNNRIAVVVASELGIYELEPRLNKQYGNRLGWVVLQRGENDYTVRQMDLFMPANLIDLYRQLNYTDPNVKGRMDVGRWGGSADIGGSPKDQGTGLPPDQILSACRDVVRKKGGRRHGKRFLTATLIVCFAVFAATLTGRSWTSDMWFGQKLPWVCMQNAFFGFHASLLYFSLMLLLFVAFRRPWQFGLMSAAGRDWWRLLPFAILCGLTGDMVVPDKLMFATNPVIAWITALVLVPLSLELLFRGFAHGIMAQLATIQNCESNWFFSRPTIGSSLLYAATIGWLVVMILPTEPGEVSVFVLVRTVTVALIFGLGAGMIRERSHSLLPALLSHLLAVVTLLLVYGTHPL